MRNVPVNSQQMEVFKMNPSRGNSIGGLTLSHRNDDGTPVYYLIVEIDDLSLKKNILLKSLMVHLLC